MPPRAASSNGWWGPFFSLQEDDSLYILSQLIQQDQSQLLTVVTAWCCPLLCLVTQSCLILCKPMDSSPPGFSVHDDFSRQEYWSGLPCPSPEDLSNSGIKPRSPSLQVNSLPFELSGTPKSTGVGSLSLLQEIFLTRELSWGLLHCRGILYQLNYQGSPTCLIQYSLFTAFHILSCIFLPPLQMASHSSTLAWEIPWTEFPTAYCSW